MLESRMVRRISLVVATLLAGLLPPGAAARNPETVVVGAYLNDIQNLDIKSHSYAADFYLWFRWKNPRLDPSSTIEFINPYDLWGHVAKPSYVKPVRGPEGLYQVVHYQGRFSAKLHLGGYPFDTQTLFIAAEDSSREASELRYEIDPEGVTVNPALKLPGFKIGALALTAREHRYNTRFGDPRLKAPSAFSRLRLEIAIERPALTYSVKLLLPILCVILCASLMLLFDPKWVDARVGIGITALLTIVALQITLNDDLPEVDYLILMDKIYLGAYLFVITGLALVLRTTRLLDGSQKTAVVRWERRALIILLTVFLAVMTALLVI